MIWWFLAGAAVIVVSHVAWVAYWIFTDQEDE